jgi:hypothetical protein
MSTMDNVTSLPKCDLCRTETSVEVGVTYVARLVLLDQDGMVSDHRMYGPFTTWEEADAYVTEMVKEPSIDDGWVEYVYHSNLGG